MEEPGPGGLCSSAEGCKSKLFTFQLSLLKGGLCLLLRFLVESVLVGQKNDVYSRQTGTRKTYVSTVFTLHLSDKYSNN